MPNGLIDDASLRVHPEGVALALTIPWYRSLWLSSVTTLRLTVDGVEVPEEDLAFELDGGRYSIADLPQQSDVLWYLQSHPLLIVRRDPAVALGETHAAEISASFGVASVPYTSSGVMDLLAAADSALYRAKQAGRNRVATAPTRPFQLDRLEDGLPAPALQAA
ncbi:MAG: diguanylate cyclase, partial [Actinobacteria bacterium]|nr:diguanylate cyclase [Actinomycetota bacterium]